MVDLEKQYWSGLETLAWMWEAAGLEEHAALTQLHRAQCRGKLNAIGRRCEWRGGVVVSRGKMEAIPQLEALDLNPLLEADDGLCLVPATARWFVETESDRTIDPDAITFWPGSQRQSEIDKGWCSLLFESIQIQSLWPDQEKLSNSRSTIAAELRCQDWLEGLMHLGPQTKTKIEYQTEAIAQFKVSARAFQRAWRSAIANTRTANWGRPGRKS